MISFFRKTRYKLAKENKFFKYSRYAIGEIFLVVIGILIALQINNWNEKRKDNEKMKMYVKGLVSDLEKDTINLKYFINVSKKEIDELSEIQEILNSPDSITTFNTIISVIPRINFLNPGPGSLNRETFKTHVAKGGIGLIPEKQINDLKNLNFYYNDFETASENSMDLIIETLMEFLNKYGYINNKEKNSLVYLSQLEVFDRAEFLRTLSNYVGFKIFLYDLMSSNAREVLKQSERTLASLKDLE